MSNGAVPGEKCCSRFDQTNISYTNISLSIMEKSVTIRRVKSNNLNADNKPCNKYDDESRHYSTK
jgi:hypothetical protein